MTILRRSGPSCLHLGVLRRGWLLVSGRTSSEVSPTPLPQKGRMSAGRQRYNPLIPV